MHFKLPLLSIILPLATPLPSIPQTDLTISSTSKINDGTKFVDFSQFNFEDWDFTELCIDCARPDSKSMYSCDFKFHWDDPNFNQSTFCQKSWNWDGVTMDHGDNNNYNLDNFVCEAKLPEYWQFKFEMLTGFWNFNLTVSRKCRDVKDFGPKGLPQFFSVPVFNLTLVSNMDNRLVYAQPGSVSAKIVGMTL